MAHCSVHVPADISGRPPGVGTAPPEEGVLLIANRLNRTSGATAPLGYERGWGHFQSVSGQAAVTPSEAEIAPQRHP